MIFGAIRFVDSVVHLVGENYFNGIKLFISISNTNRLWHNINERLVKYLTLERWWNVKRHIFTVNFPDNSIECTVPQQNRLKFMLCKAYGHWFCSLFVSVFFFLFLSRPILLILFWCAEWATKNFHKIIIWCNSFVQRQIWNRAFGPTSVVKFGF